MIFVSFLPYLWFSHCADVASQKCDCCSVSFIFQIGRQFGYFPKDAVKEEQVHAAVEKVVETQVNTDFSTSEKKLYYCSRGL